MLQAYREAALKPPFTEYAHYELANCGNTIREIKQFH
jgi:hypothetical protein